MSMTVKITPLLNARPGRSPKRGSSLSESGGLGGRPRGGAEILVTLVGLGVAFQLGGLSGYNNRGVNPSRVRGLFV